jgi:hypothetical protein
MTGSVLLVLLTLVGCFGNDTPRRAGPRRDRHLLNPGTPQLGAGSIPEGSPRLDPSVAAGPTLDALPPDQPGLVVLLVVEGARADRLGACGGEHDTSPALQALIDRGGAFTCEGRAPATWSLASRATLVTGRDPEDHGVLRRGGALRADLPTLAETMAAHGYQTMLVSGSTSMRKGTGLARGFHQAHVGVGAVGDGLVRALRYELAKIDPSHPLFLQIDVTDALEPYDAIPEGVAWAPAQPALTFEGEGPWTALRAGTLAGPARDAFLGQVRQGYDHDLLRADTTLGQVVQTLERHELGKHGVRLVVTADRGTSLGEHDLLGQGGLPWEPVARVPVLLLDSTQREAMPKLPEPFPLAAVSALVETGRPPAPGAPVHAVSAENGEPGAEDAVALWTSTTRKVLARGGGVQAYDLAKDPGEAAPVEATPEERAAAEAALARWTTALATARSVAVEDGPADPPARPRRRRPAR